MTEGSPARELYLAIVDDVFTAYAEGRFDDGLARLESAPDELEAWQAELAYHRACLLGASGAPDAALTALQSAAAAGGWWDPDVLGDEDDLSALRGRADFEELVTSSAGRWKRGQSLDRSGDIRLAAAGPARGLLVALHGAEEDASDAVRAWGAAREVGLEVLAVRSSRRTSPNYRTWGPDAASASDLADALATHGVDTGEPLYVAGFSAGGRIAIDWALRGQPTRVAGVIAVAPAITTEALPPVASAPVLDPAHILVGSEDDLLDDVLAVGESLAGAGFRVDVLDGVGHEVPDAEVRQALGVRGRGPRGRPSTGWASLTPTELEVIRVVVQGRSNPEIAERLLMSRGTVKAHLAHVYAKLDVANRTELASLAAPRLEVSDP